MTAAQSHVMETSQPEANRPHCKAEPPSTGDSTPNALPGPKRKSTQVVILTSARRDNITKSHVFPTVTILLLHVKKPCEPVNGK